MDYNSKTKEELIKICKSRNISDYSDKNKQEIILLIQRQEENERRMELYQKQLKERQQKLERGEQVDAVPLIRVDEDVGYEVTCIVLTRFNDKYAITKFFHYSWYSTQYDEEEDEHTLSFSDVIEDAEDGIHHAREWIARFYELILEHQEEILEEKELSSEKDLLENKDPFTDDELIAYEIFKR